MEESQFRKPSRKLREKLHCLPREWCCPQWAASSYINQQSRQSPMDICPGHSYLKVPPWMTVGCVKLAVKTIRTSSELSLYSPLTQHLPYILLLFSTCLSVHISNNLTSHWHVLLDFLCSPVPCNNVTTSFTSLTSACPWLLNLHGVLTMK